MAAVTLDDLRDIFVRLREMAEELDEEAGLELAMEAYARKYTETSPDAACGLLIFSMVALGAGPLSRLRVSDLFEVATSRLQENPSPLAHAIAGGVIADPDGELDMRVSAYLYFQNIAVASNTPLPPWFAAAEEDLRAKVPADSLWAWIFED